MKVVVAVDDSPYSSKVLSAVAHRHWPADVQFKILTVVEPLDWKECQCECETLSVVSKINKERHEHAEKLCQEARHKLEKAVPDAIVHYEVRNGKPTEQIVDSAVEWDADRIMLGAHGHNVCPHNLPGSVSRGVTTHAHCSVEVVRAGERVKEKQLV